MQSFAKLITLCGALLLAASSYAQPACSVGIQVDDGYVYDTSRIRDLVVKEVRKELSRVDKPFTIKVTRSCSDTADQSFELGMRTGNLYILKWNGIDLDPDVVRYTDEPLDINVGAFDKAVTDGLVFDKLSKADKQRTLKMFAFVFAEAARFSNVEDVVHSVLNSNCSIKWNDYSRLLRSWKLISIFANDKALISGTPYIGGSRAFLIAPITAEMVTKYNEAIGAGWPIEDGEYAASSKLDPVKFTANTPAPSCKN